MSTFAFGVSAWIIVINLINSKHFELACEFCFDDEQVHDLQPLQKKGGIILEE